jgi:hypothetical protein
MMKSWSEKPVLYEVSQDVMLTSGVLFVPGNSASAEFSAASMALMVGAQTVTGLIGRHAHSLPPQSEAWVPRRIPRAAITRVLVQDESVRTHLLTWLGRHPEVRVPEIGMLDRFEAP